MSEQRTQLSGSARALPPDARRVGVPDPAEQIEVTVTLRGPDLPGTAPVLAVDPAAFAARYGASQADADRVEQELSALGLQVYDVSLPGRSLHAQGTPAQLTAAFGVQLGLFDSTAHGRFRGREGDLEVPTPLAGIVTGVFGLDNRRMARRQASTTAPATGPWLTPADLEQRYGFPVGDGARQAIAIAEFGGAYFPQDLKDFCDRHQRLTPTVTQVAVSGQELVTWDSYEHMSAEDKNDTLGTSGEVMLDVEIIGSLCPEAAISVYFSTFDQKGWVDLLNAVTAAPATPVALSVSYSWAEDDGWTAAALTEINQRLQAAALHGITVCASSGDDGVGAQVADGKPHVGFPASSPWVLAVGGTMLTSDEQEEVAWWQQPGQRRVSNVGVGGGSTGGGVSTVFPRPAWQDVKVASLHPSGYDGRVIPDVAALAGWPYYDYLFWASGSEFSGGTSASTPLWAALLARITAGMPADKQRRFLTPLLYGNASGGSPVGQVGCRDITAGDNRSVGFAAGYPAGAGFDAVTGWGVPDGAALRRLLL